MRFTYIVVATIAVTIATPVVADPSFTSYYLVQDQETNTCKVVDVKPPPMGFLRLFTKVVPRLKLP